MSFSEWYSDEELISQLRMFFDMDEAENIDFQVFLGQIEEIDDDLCRVKIKNRVFQFSKTFCDVEEVE